MPYLDNTGLQRVWANTKEYIDLQHVEFDHEPTQDEIDALPNEAIVVRTDLSDFYNPNAKVVRFDHEPTQAEVDLLEYDTIAVRTDIPPYDITAEEVGIVDTYHPEATNVSEAIAAVNSDLEVMEENVLNLYERITIIENRLFQVGAGAHNSTYRGMQRGGSDGTPTASEYAAIASGDFRATVGGETSDLYIGDYWVRNGMTYKIGCFDYMLNCGDTPTTDHHALMVPDTSFYNSAMNDTNTTAGGYVNSNLRMYGLQGAFDKVNGDFPYHLLLHREYLTTAVTNGRPSAGSWFDSSIDLMNEIMVYGTNIFSPVSDGATVPANRTVSKFQLPLFRMNPASISNQVASYWLRDVISGATFAMVSAAGLANYGNASDERGVRPYFLLKG